MSDLRKAAEQALEALEANLGNWAAKTKATTALREALAQPEQQPEWYHGVDERGCNCFYHKTEVRPFDFSTPLYTAPLQSEALPRRMESEIKFHRLEEVRKAAQKIGVGYSLNYCESDDSWFFTIESVAPAEYWCGKNHSFNIAVDCVLEQLKLFENHNEKNT